MQYLLYLVLSNIPQDLSKIGIEIIIDFIINIIE